MVFALGVFGVYGTFCFNVVFDIVTRRLWSCIFFSFTVVLSHYKLQFVTVMKYGALRSWNSDVSCQINFLKCIHVINFAL